MEADGTRIHPSSWTLSEQDSASFGPHSQIRQASTSNLSSQAMSTNILNMDNYRTSRQAEAIRWIDLQERRSSIISRLQPTTAEEYQHLRDAVTSENAPIRRTVKKKTGMKHISSSPTPHPSCIFISATKSTTQNQHNATNGKGQNLPKTPFNLLSRRQYNLLFSTYCNIQITIFSRNQAKKA